MYQALYRSYRPETFDSLLGQEHIVRILTSQINSQTTGHAYLFCGTRGTGKTSTARLLAKGMNCLAPQGQRPCGECAACKAIASGTFVDVLEIDAASNNGVDNIRELRESVNFPPAIGRTKVYIIDEAHMLSNSAANALLKTLEEPPSSILFILATTEPQKIPATIISRCMRLDFRRVSEIKIKERFSQICQEMKVDIQDEALDLIAANADGSVRDGLSILDRCICGFGKVTRDDVLAVLGMASEDVYLEITENILNDQIGQALLLFNQMLAEGKEVSQFAKDWVEHFRNLMIIKFVKEPQSILNVSLESIERLKGQAQRISLEEIKRHIFVLSEAIDDAKWSPKPRILVELAIVRMQKSKERAPLSTEVKREEISPTDSTPKAQEEEGLSKIWKEVLLCEEVSLMLRTSGSQLKEMTDKSFIVQVRNQFQEDCFLETKSLFERLMEKTTGRRLHMELAVSEAEAQESFL
ncbi:MAG: DNA polymerase III subunit gamma/tau [Clostridia bacterium]|nr:DNA polymerase III subunit gamma/tau [Clostridia bacterium]